MQAGFFIDYLCNMPGRKLKNPIFLFYILVGYIVIQFSWWLYLIFSLYQKTYQDESLLTHKKWMLLGEGSVFLLILLGGVYIIRRAFKREQEINRLQQNFLHSVSHELKTPVTSIRLFIETLQKHNLAEKQKTDIYKRSLSEVNRLNHLISDILTARNIESENYFIHVEPINLAEFIKDKVDLLKHSLLADFDTKIETEPIVLNLDKEAMNSVLLNLLENASKYSPKGSTIAIKLKNIKNGQAVLTIEDEGSGVKDELKDKVFEKFYRPENELTRKSKGTGLGLYITKFLVELQGGKIKLKDNKAGGLTVEIIF